MKTILLIDDDETILETYGMALEHSGYHVVTACSGTEGLEQARRHLPDLVLTDINMPGMDGRGLLKALRQDAELGTRQIVLMTGNVKAVTPRAGMELGADDFLEKPFSYEELVRCIEARLRRASVHWRVEDKIVSDLRSTLQATLPHEFLTPLTGILGLTQLLLEEQAELPPQEVRAMLADIEKSGKRLHRTLKNYFAILDLPAGESPPPTTVGRLSPQDVQEAVRAGMDTAARRHERTADVSADLAETTLHCTGHAISTIVEELVDNACSFSRPGTAVRVKLDGAGVLTVRDEGRGMTSAQIGQIGAFQQFDRRKYEQQGLGLGLVLAQRLLEQCGGRLAVDSEPGKGTTVTVRFAV